MSLKDMQNVAKQHGVSAVELCEKAGLSRATFYRKKDDESSLLVDEYDKLAKVLAAITKRKART